MCARRGTEPNQTNNNVDVCVRQVGTSESRNNNNKSRSRSSSRSRRGTDWRWLAGRPPLPAPLRPPLDPCLSKAWVRGWERTGGRAERSAATHKREKEKQTGWMMIGEPNWEFDVCQEPGAQRASDLRRGSGESGLCVYITSLPPKKAKVNRAKSVSQSSSRGTNHRRRKRRKKQQLASAWCWCGGFLSPSSLSCFSPSSAYPADAETFLTWDVYGGGGSKQNKTPTQTQARHKH